MADPSLRIGSNKLCFFWKGDQCLRGMFLYVKRSGICCKRFQRVHSEHFLQFFFFFFFCYFLVIFLFFSCYFLVFSVFFVMFLLFSFFFWYFLVIFLSFFLFFSWYFLFCEQFSYRINFYFLWPTLLLELVQMNWTSSERWPMS